MLAKLLTSALIYMENTWQIPRDQISNKMMGIKKKHCGLNEKLTLGMLGCCPDLINFTFYLNANDWN